LRITPSAWLLSLPLTALLILVLTSSYALAMPSYQRFSAGCGKLLNLEDRHNVLVHLPAPQANAHKALEIFDPLCPACKAFEERLQAARLDKRLERELLLFPLDNTCNWMVESAMHPGSCDVSLAVLCAGERAQQVIDWAFAEQRTILKEAARDKHAAERMVSQRFPELQTCMKSATTKARLSQSLRWAVKNQVPVLTPQFYVNGKRLCDEDTDLGLEYTLTRMLEEDGS
jgi:protein-disulfide isomerase